MIGIWVCVRVCVVFVDAFCVLVVTDGIYISCSKEEEAEYIKWLKGHKTELQTDEMKDMDALRRYWTDPNLDPDEAFLRDYVLNKKWIDGDTKK